MRGRLVVRITPDDVGRRVSIRSRLEAAGGGPSTTDTVGRLVDWTDGVLTVQRRDGSPVSLPIGDVLAARVIPEPPVNRPRR